MCFLRLAKEKQNVTHSDNIYFELFCHFETFNLLISLFNILQHLF